MSNKRYALSKEDVELILAGLEQLHRDSIINPEVYSNYELASRQRVNQLRKLFGTDNNPLVKKAQS